MTVEAAIAMFVLLMINTWFNYRLGYRNGVKGGHYVGVRDTLDLVLDQPNVSITVNNEQLPLDDLTCQVINELCRRRAAAMEKEAVLGDHSGS